MLQLYTLDAGVLLFLMELISGKFNCMLSYVANISTNLAIICPEINSSKYLDYSWMLPLGLCFCAELISCRLDSHLYN